MNIRIAMLGAACVAISGCVQYQDLQKADAAAKAEAQAQAQGRSDDAQCRSAGFVSETPGYVQCRTDLENQRAQPSSSKRTQ
jgi:predicted aminopeptidase